MRKRPASLLMIFLAFVIPVAFMACGGGGGGDPTPGPGPSPAGDGSMTQPMRLYVDTPHGGQTGGLTSVYTAYYYFQSAAAGPYVISLTQSTSDLGWRLYTSPGFATFPTESCYENGEAGNERCIVNLAAGTYYYLSVTNWDFSAATFTVTVSEGVGDGSTGSPVMLTVGQTHYGDVPASASSYYAFTPSVGDGDGSYSVEIANSLDANGASFLFIDVDIYGDPSFSGAPIKSCGMEINPTCTANGLSAGTTYYVKVTELRSTDTLYDITVRKGISEGSTATPVQLALGSAHSGAADAMGSSYYAFTIPAGGEGSYVVTLDSVTTDYPGYVHVYVYADFASAPIAECTAAAACSASGLGGGTTYYVEVSNYEPYYWYDETDITYNITVSAGQCVGSPGAPVVLTPGVQYSGGMEADCISYFSFTTTQSGDYDVDAVSAPGYMWWNLYSDAGFASQMDSWYEYAGPWTASTVNLDGATTYYLKVANLSVSGPLVFTISPGYGEGSPGDPVTIAVDTPHSMQVEAWGESYYQFTPGVDGDYVITVNNATHMHVFAFSNPDFSTGQVAYCYYDTYHGCAFDISLTAGTTYYVKMREGIGTDVTYDLIVEYPDPSAGCGSGALGCLDFEGSFPPPDFTQVAGDEGDWVQDNSNSADPTGTKSAKAASLISYLDEKCVEYAPAADHWKVGFSLATDSGTDGYLRFYMDGIMVSESWYGLTPWKKVIISAGSLGTHTYKWCYYKGNTGDPGNNAVWLDDIEIH